MTKKYQVMVECTTFLVVDIHSEEGTEEDFMNHGKSFCYTHLMESSYVQEVRSISVVDINKIEGSEE